MAPRPRRYAELQARYARLQEHATEREPGEFRRVDDAEEGENAPGAMALQTTSMAGRGRGTARTAWAEATGTWAVVVGVVVVASMAMVAGPFGQTWSLRHGASTGEMTRHLMLLLSCVACRPPVPAAAEAAPPRAIGQSVRFQRNAAGDDEDDEELLSS